MRTIDDWYRLVKETIVTVWMVVEDEPDLYDVFVAMLEIWGVDGSSFADGLEVIQWVDALDESTLEKRVLPELAILDIRLPNASGLEVAARLRRSQWLSNIGILLITAYRLTPAQEQQALTISGADQLIYKPLPTADELHRLLVLPTGSVDKSSRRKTGPE